MTCPAGVLPAWLEVHVDEEVINGAPGRLGEACALLDRVARLAEDRGARLSFRFRLQVALRAPDLLADLARRGHEVGAHAHGRGLAEVVAALGEAGLSVKVAAPGLVQAGAGGRSLLLRQARALGIDVVTDHGPDAAWAYEGLLGRSEEGLWVMAPTVRPFDWGLMERDGHRRGLQGADFDRLRTLEAAATGHGAEWFGVVLHEHDLCPPGSLRPSQPALDALAAWLDERVLPSASVDRPVPAPAPRPRRVPSDGRVRVARALHMAVGAARQHAPQHLPAVRLPGLPHRRLRVGDRELAVERHGPDDPVALCVVSHAGRQGGRKTALTPFGIGLRTLLGLGWAAWLFDRAGTGDSAAPRGMRHHPLAPGNPAHTDDWAAVLARARREGVPVIALSFSAGVLPVLMAAARGERPDALVDAEGPADRWSLVPPDPARGAGVRERDPWHDAAWVGLEPATLLCHLGVPYARLQGAIDHVHGPMTVHAFRMVAAAQESGLPVRPFEVLEAHLHGHPAEVLDALEWARRAAGAQTV